MKKCPFCAEEIQDEAKKCRHCGEFLEASTAALIKPGDTFGPYRIEKELGRGGMGTVYLAEDTSLGRKVAFKLLPAGLAHDPDLAKRFKKEAQIAAGLIHPNIISVFAVGETPNGQPYYAMTLLSGGALADRLRSGPLAVSEALRLTQDILAGLGFAHSKEVIHRDIKPGNILFTENGSAVIVDFGIAHASIGTRVETISGSLIGTPHYMSPEQWNGKAVDRRSDLYAVGAMLFQMLTGQVPFVGQDVNAIMCGHLLHPVPPISSVIPAIPAQLEALVMKALAKEPENRFQSAEEFHQAIENEMGVSGRTPLPKPDLTRTIPLSTPLPAVPATPIPAPAVVVTRSDQGAGTPVAGPWYDHPWLMFFVGALCVPVLFVLYAIWTTPAETVPVDGTVPAGVASLSASAVPATVTVPAAVTVPATVTIPATITTPMASETAGPSPASIGPATETALSASVSSNLSRLLKSLSTADPGDAGDPGDGKSASATALPAMSGGRIAFRSDETGTFQVHVANLDGTECSKITSVTGGVRLFRVSPNGRRIAFLPEDTMEIRFVGLDGKDEAVFSGLDLPARSEITSLAWFPDGERIACSILETTGGKLRTTFVALNAAKGGRKDLGVVSGAECRISDVFPDGTSLIFNQRESRDDDEGWILWDLDLESGEMSSYEDAGVGGRFSADGSRLLFARFTKTEAEDAQTNVAIQDPDGTNERLYTSAKPGKSCLEPTWNADGSRVFYVYFNGESYKIWSFAADDKDFRRFGDLDGNQRDPEFVRGLGRER